MPHDSGQYTVCPSRADTHPPGSRLGCCWRPAAETGGNRKGSMARFHKKLTRSKKRGCVRCVCVSICQVECPGGKRTKRPRGNVAAVLRPRFNARDPPRTGTVASSSPPGLVNQSVPIHGRSCQGKEGPVSAGDTNPDSSTRPPRDTAGIVALSEEKKNIRAGIQGNIALVVLQPTNEICPFPGLPKEASWFSSFVRSFGSSWSHPHGQGAKYRGGIPTPLTADLEATPYADRA